MPSEEVKVIEMTNVVALPLDDEDLNILALLEPETCLRVLHSVSGDVTRFVQKFASEALIQQDLLYRAELTMSKAPALYAEWKEAIKRNQRVRLRLLQDKELETLERKSSISLKPNEELARSKLILGDLFAGEIQAVKKPSEGTVSSLYQGEEEDDSEDAALAESLMNV